MLHLNYEVHKRCAGVTLNYCTGVAGYVMCMSCGGSTYIKIFQLFFPSVSSQLFQTLEQFVTLIGGSKEMHDDPFLSWASNLLNLLWPI